MKTKLARRKTRKLPRTSPAIHFLRPIFLTIVALFVYGCYHESGAAIATGVALGFVSVLPALVLHSSYRGRQERNKEIFCG